MNTASELMLATGNPGKVAELRELLAAYLDLNAVKIWTPRDWPTALPEVTEDGQTFAENALSKATALANITGIPALADDSGLCVDALGGQPGLHSARWAGPQATDADRNQKLLEALTGVSVGERTAQFVCAVVLAVPGGAHYNSLGVCHGSILEEPHGNNGFGYDPLFLVSDLGRTMAELLPAEKNERSHRAIALNGLAGAFPVIFGDFSHSS